MKRKNLSADYLYSLVKEYFGQVREHRTGIGNIKISMADALMSGLAVFALKKPSLLSFEDSIRADTPLGESLRNLFLINTPASDTQLRAILDPVCAKDIRSPFKRIFAELQRANMLKEFRYLDQGYLIALDGTGHFSSGTVKCNDCIEKKSRTGETTYYHQLFGASIVHPKHGQVIPLCPEAISNRDGDSKQDCEFKSAQRWVKKFRAEHPKLDGVIVLDALFSNAPMIKLLLKNNLHYIMGVKPAKHKALVDQFELNKRHGLVEESSAKDIIGERINKIVTHSFKFLNGLSLNTAHPEMKVNFLEYSERTEYADPSQDKKNIGTKVKNFTWITEIKLTRENVAKIMRAGRARWKIENETFQTLKIKSAYNLDHSYGHGKDNLCTIYLGC